MNQSQVLHPVRVRSGLVFGVIIITALLAFEIFNYSTTDYALADLLGDLRSLGMKWSTILAIAFCGIDFAGIARLFSFSANSSKSSGFHIENWYLFGAWLLAATMNAMLTWWGVSLAVIGHHQLGNEVVGREMLVRVVPVFVAVLVWLIRVLIIGTFSMAGDKLLGHDPVHTVAGYRPQAQPQPHPAFMAAARPAPRPIAASASGHRSPAPNAARMHQAAHIEEPAAMVEEPTYHPINGNNNANDNGNGRYNGGATPTRSTFIRPPSSNFRR